MHRALLDNGKERNIVSWYMLLEPYWAHKHDTVTIHVYAISVVIRGDQEAESVTDMFFEYN